MIGLPPLAADSFPLNHVVNISGGIVSFLAGCRVVESEGRSNVTLLFADVMMEDEDLYRFNKDASDYLGIPITRVSLEMTPWELFKKEGMIGNSRSPLCSVKLKREILDKWHRSHCLEFDTIIYVGIDWTESHRLDRLRESKPTWRIEAPMCSEPFLDKCQMVEAVRAKGLVPPRLYGMGFPHNNCGGFCVKAGQAHFAHLLKAMPERYAFHEKQEEETRQLLRSRNVSSWDYSVLKDRRGGKTQTLTLRQLRESIEAGKSFDRHDWGGCGCSVE